ncbi:DUF808 domain-containing protein [Corynebacterium sp. P7003]|uniref:DUF808 domain-containing protein n=1 Tax=Corynebacterium pygosceleis TaxID=2800406 RepID=A0ABT3WUH1_9CORY|nr:DUF808 domain-containing protein [Corynebacterium pygosceleis]MCX7444438.1 DUF808 domain-containing protein [Corynebacterium pygosceleis]
MAGGLAALLDDVALIARTAAASVDDVAAAAGRTSAKAAGVVVDDAAVTPRFVQGVRPARELPIIWRITKGSLFNKLVIILPLALLLSAVAPWVLTPILMLGGTYLCYEGAEKVWEKFSGSGGGHDTPVRESGPDAEDRLVKGAITTDLILSAEIMVISLNEVATEPFWTRTSVLVIVALFITALVYGAVAVLIKMDDVGLKLAKRPSRRSKKFGRALVSAMPKVLDLIAVIGTFAMLWVGGHIILVGIDEFGFHAPYGFVHHMEEAVRGWSGVGGAAAWIVNTFFSMVVGVIWGAIVLGVLHNLPFGRKKH